MATAVRSLHFFIIIFAFVKLLAWAQGEVQFIYNGFQGASLHLGGIAKIHPDGLLQLTNTSKQQIGRAFHPFPVKFNTSSSGDSTSLSFSTLFAFAMVPELQTYSGHGIVFTIAPSMDFPGAVASQYFGLFNITTNGLFSNHVFAVELDTVLSPDLNDTDNNHVGVDVNSLESNISAPVTYFSDKEGKNKSLELVSGKAMQIWIDYDDVQKLLHVTVAPLESPKPNMTLLSTPIDLSSVFLESMYVGFSSATGALVSDHYILGWSFNRSGQAQSLEISELPSAPSRRKERKKLGLAAIMSITVAIVLIVIMGAAYIIRKMKFEELQEEWEREYGPQRISYKDLYKATNGFEDKELLGVGGFGKVYRGRLPSSNSEIAVKKVSHDSKQGMREFVAEIASMGRLRHRNLVQLLGYCRRRGELLLVYDYMPNGSLDKFLFSNEKPSLSWPQRYHILRGVASGLLYLHEEWEQVVLHRDVKASNVLLDANLNGRLGDFGLAKFYDHDTNPQTTNVVGTVGYMAPELTRTGKATSSTDVFSFGAFMLETACGRKPVVHGCPEGVVLVDWVLECWKRGAILLTSDPRLEGNYVAEEMELVLKLGLLCSHPVPAVRPSMRQVMQYLDGNATLPEIPHYFASMGTFGANNVESSELIMPFPSSSRTTVHSFSSSDSILDISQ